MSSALITGVAGFVGSHLAGQLLSQGVSVIGVDSLTEYYDPALKRSNLEPLIDFEDFRLVEADLKDLDLPELLLDAERVFHLAAQPGVRRSWGKEFELYLEENLHATQLLLEAARTSDVERCVFASSSSIYGDAETLPTQESETPMPVSPYGLTKLAGEHLCRLYFSRFGVPVIALRYFTIFGPRQRPDMAFTRFIEAATSGQPVEVFGDGLQTRDFTYVQDAVEGTIAAAQKGRPGEIYNIAGGAQASILGIIELLGGLLGCEVSTRHLPSVPGDARHTGGDTRKAGAELGYAPRTTLQEGLAAQVAFQRGPRQAAKPG